MLAKTSHPLRAIAPATLLSKPLIHPQHEEIDRQVVSYLIETWEWPSERAKKGFISWKLSDVVLYMFPTGITARVQLACELLLLGFLMDDWFDNHTFAENAVVVSRLNALLSNPETFTPTTTIEHMHHRIFTLILAVHSDAETERDVLATYMRMLDCHCDPARATTTSLRDYLPYREVDVGMPICTALLYWTEDLSLPEADVLALEPLEHVANYHVSILNDVFSFEREWAAAQELGQAAVLVNGVRILASETGVGVQSAKRLCFALVRAWEGEFQMLAAEVLADERIRDREGVRRIVAGIERRMTGAEEFSWRTKRYL